MTTNPNNAVGTNGAFGGRTSANAFNDGLAAYSRGILSGWGCTPSSGLTVTIGGDGNTRDVAIAEDNAGNKTTVNNISGSPVSVTVGNAPNNNSRIDSIVAYVDNPPTGTSTVTDNYGACGLIVVAGTVSSSPSAPTESAIRTAITADGASGTTAYYVVLANITVASGTTSITTSNIQAGGNAGLNPANFGATQWMSTQNITWRNNNTVVGTTVCNMIPLDGNGLTLCAINGTAWQNNSSGAGVVNAKGSWAQAPVSVIGANVDASFTADLASYKTYSEVNLNNIDLWINKSSAGTKNLLVQILILAYF